MTKDEIIRFAIKCKLVNTNNRDGIYMDALIDFAKLVEDKVRQEIAEKNAPVIKKVNENKCCSLFRNNSIKLVS